LLHRPLHERRKPRPVVRRPRRWTTTLRLRRTRQEAPRRATARRLVMASSLCTCGTRVSGPGRRSAPRPPLVGVTRRTTGDLPYARKNRSPTHGVRRTRPGWRDPSVPAS